MDSVQKKRIVKIPYFKLEQLDGYRRAQAINDLIRKAKKESDTLMIYIIVDRNDNKDDMTSVYNRLIAINPDIWHHLIISDLDIKGEDEELVVN